MTANPWSVKGAAGSFEADAPRRLGAGVGISGEDRLAAQVARESGRAAAAGRR